VLAELVELALAERLRRGSPRASAKELLGPELWSLVDRDVPALGGPVDARGPAGRPLLRILERVERQ